MSQSDQRLFTIQSDPCRYFYAGSLPGGRQALIGRSVYGQIEMAVFDAGGDLLEICRSDLPSPPVEPDSDLIREVDEDEFHEYLRKEYGFTPGVIRIKEFG